MPNRRWKYDIYIPSKNIIVEVHGVQHYQFESFFHKTKEDFIRAQERDRKKRNYAEWLGYDFIEVNYREGKPELALERFIEAFNQRQTKKQLHVQLTLL